MGALEVSHLGFAFAGGATLFDDVSFRVGEGQHVALVGANGAGKTTLLRLITGDETGATGTITIDGRLGAMRQFIGTMGDELTVRSFLLSLSPAAVQEAAARLHAAELDGDGVKVAEAWVRWGDVGGYDAEVLWDTCCTKALRASLDDAGERSMRTLSGGEQKRLALELLLRSDADPLLLDEPDNYLDVPSKEWLEQRLVETKKTVLYVSHDRELLARTSHKVVTLEARSCWTHGGSFATWHDARQDRLARIDEEHRRWREEHKRLEAQVTELRRRIGMGADSFTSRLQATKTKMRRHEAAAPAERPRDQNISIRLAGDRTGKRAVTVSSLSFPGLVDPFETEVLFGERVGILGRNGTGKTHFLGLLAGAPVDHTGTWTLGARVVPGYFSQTHDHPELVGRRVLDVLLSHGFARGAAMAALRRYELQGAAEQPFETLSGGQQARLQILLLELSGATLLLLDEPTDNLDVASAEALEDALGEFTGTVLAVTHDRWFLRAFDRFLVFSRDGSVRESLEPVFD
ncbi:MAG TPA: ATP-binding cassette domain-containing protein [Acidimicrobiales bacterium]|nr:ATP-binding cassette domain-containing protein [Acidimicrobiales bacterium]